MNLTLEDFQAIQWERNPFAVVDQDVQRLCLVVQGLSVQGRPQSEVRLIFSQPSSEWAMLWDEGAKAWVSHPDSKEPIGPVIVEAWVKPSHIGLLFSFAGHHQKGWSRWGFTAQRAAIAPDEE
jgi:hypothetical protein